MSIKNNNIIFIYILAVFVLDIFSKRILDTNYAFLFLIKIIKLLGVIYSIFFLIKIKNFSILYKILILFIITAIASFTLYSAKNYRDNFNLIELITLFINYIFVFLFGLWLGNTTTQQNISKLRILAQVIIFIVIVSIILGLLFEIPLFKTYPYGERFGFNGVIQKSITATYFFTGALFYQYHLTIKVRSIYNITLLLLLSFCCFIVGTKALVINFILLSIYSFLNLKLHYTKFAFDIAFVLISSLYLTYQQIFVLFQNKMNFIIEFYKKNDLITFISSNRNLIFKENYNFYNQNWLTLNYFIGGKFNHQKLFEMCVLDLITMFGFIGTIYYLFLFYKYIIARLSQKARIDKCFFYFFWFTILITATFSGQFFYNNSAIIYTLIFAVLLSTSSEIKNKNNNYLK